MQPSTNVSRSELLIGLGVALLAVALAVFTAVYTAPLMLARGWLSLRAAIFALSIGATLWGGIGIPLSCARRL